jgi:hypothetical protein
MIAEGTGFGDLLSRSPVHTGGRDGVSCGGGGVARSRAGGTLSGGGAGRDA